MSQTDPFAPLQRGPSRRRPDGEAPRVGVPRPSAVPPESSDDVFGRLPRASVPTVADAELVVPSRRARREAERRGTAEQPVVAASVSGGAVPGGAVPEGDGDVPDGGAPLPVPSVPRPRNRWVSVALVVVSMLMAAVSVATVLPVASGLVAAAAGLAPLLLVPGLVVVAWAVHTRRHVSCVLACVAALLPWLLVGGYVTAAPPPPTGAPGLRVMLVNGAGGEADAADIVAQAQGQGASLLVVTELTDLLAHDLTTAGIGRTMTPRGVGDAASGRGGPACGAATRWSRSCPCPARAQR
ncbi:MAG: hypothetical protein U0Q15_14510 [Kineosporiaceae bacterium]